MLIGAATIPVYVGSDGTAVGTSLRFEIEAVAVFAAALRHPFPRPISSNVFRVAVSDDVPLQLTQSAGEHITTPPPCCRNV